MDRLDELRARRARLERLRYGGAARVKHGDKDTQYRSEAELARALADLDARIARAEGRSQPRFERLIYGGKGL